MFISYHDLKQEQGRDLDYKIGTAVDAISSALAVCRHRPALAFSAGKDSTVLWDLIRRYFPEQVARLAVIYSRHLNGRFHALGITSEKLLTQFPFTSVDSTWWVFKNREKVRRLAPGKGRKDEQVARVRHLMALEKESGKGYQQALGF